MFFNVPSDILFKSHRCLSLDYLAHINRRQMLNNLMVNEFASEKREFKVVGM